MGYLIYKNRQQLKWDIELEKCPDKQNGKFNFLNILRKWVTLGFLIKWDTSFLKP